ncbi:MAG TPA: MarC family NAAT transporter [Thermodesulfobacteriota bacterium]|nr:MarC family NAAT transporter [Thermodesulfobacteriota bacterium]
MSDFTQILLGTIVSLLPIVNPFSVAVTFISLSKDMDDGKRRRQALLASVYMAAILIVFLIAGVLIMKFFGISLPGIRIAGGIIITYIGFRMLNPELRDPQLQGDGAKSADEDIAFTPIAMPMLSGPGAIAVTVGMAANAGSRMEYAAESLGILVVAAITFILLRIAGGVKRLLGNYGVTILTRIMGFLLICIGVQFVMLGILDFIHS